MTDYDIMQPTNAPQPTSTPVSSVLSVADIIFSWIMIELCPPASCHLAPHMDLFSHFSNYFHLFHLSLQMTSSDLPLSKKDIQNNQRGVTYPENIHNEKMNSDYFLIIWTIKPNGKHQMAKAFIVLIQIIFLQLSQRAREIYNSFLSSKATMPVNIDSQAQLADDVLTSPRPDMFKTQQLQVSVSSWRRRDGSHLDFSVFAEAYWVSSVAIWVCLQKGPKPLPDR